MKQILIIEDDNDIQEMISTYLQEEGYSTTSAMDGVMAIELFHKQTWDLILLDIMLPKIDGYGVCELIRKESNVPIIMLTALDSEQNQLQGYNLEIDDYVVKPFSISILLRKIAIVLKRNNQALSISNHKIHYQDLILDLDAYIVTVNGRQVDITNREFELLLILLNNPGRVLTRSILLEKIWGYDFFW
ncbi:MAG: response regulator transcription factor [Coprobacillaceae bacterium]